MSYNLLTLKISFALCVNTPEQHHRSSVICLRFSNRWRWVLSRVVSSSESCKELVNFHRVISLEDVWCVTHPAGCGWMDGWLGGWMDGWVDGRMGGAYLWSELQRGGNSILCHPSHPENNPSLVFSDSAVVQLLRASSSGRGTARRQRLKKWRQTRLSLKLPGQVLRFEGLFKL